MADDKRNNEIIRIQKKSNNFVMLDKGFLDDDRLSFKAKGILAYLLSKPDNWKVVVGNLIKHAKDGEKAVYSGLRELKKYGYYKKVPIRDTAGHRISHWESVIFECPEEEKPMAYENDNEDFLLAQNGQIEESGQNSTSHLLGHFVQVENVHKQDVDVQSVHVQNGYRNNNYYNNTNNDSINLSEEQTSDEMDEIDEIDTYVSIVKKNISYDYLILPERRNDIEIIDELVNLMVDTIVFNNEPVKIKGSTYPAEVIKTQFLKLNAFHIEYVLDCLRKNTTKVRNIKSYLIATLYNAPATISNHYRAETNHDLYGGGS